MIDYDHRRADFLGHRCSIVAGMQQRLDGKRSWFRTGSFSLQQFSSLLDVQRVRLKEGETPATRARKGLLFYC